jgi:hypothetical protein
MSPSSASFAAALLDPTRAVPAGLRAWNGSDPARRFAVYRNNVVTSLVDALADTFPVVRELVGSGFFDAMARVFVAAHPPASPVLSEYGDALPGFVETFGPAASVPYLADVARLERARVCAFHAADAPALAPAAIAPHLADAQALPQTRLVLNPSVAVVASRFAIVSLWAAHQGQGDIAGVDPLQPEAALVLRQGDEVAVITIAHADAGFLRALLDGCLLGAAVDRAARGAPADGQPFDLAAAFGLLLGHGALTGWKAPLEP